jgi:hypothetical protein
MCVSLLATGMQAAGNLQAFAGGMDAIGSLAAGVTRARMMRSDARGAEAYAATKAKRIRAAGALELGAARTQAAASGVKVDSGSVMDVERTIVKNVEQDALSAILTGQNQAASLNESARYYQVAGLNSAADNLIAAGSNWRRTRRETPSLGGGGGYIPQAGE